MVQSPRVVVIDDDPAIRTLVRRVLRDAGYHVQEAARDSIGEGCVPERDFDILIVDIDSPAGDGLNVIRTTRALSSVPILALSTRGDEEATVSALGSGADDYVRKPFGNRELLARVENALRRRAREQGQSLRVTTDELQIDLLHRRVRLRGRDVRLPVKPYEVLKTLAESAGQVVTSEQILSAVWGPRGVAHEDYLRLAIRRLRSKLEGDPAHPRYILTERGVGYRLETGNR